MKRKPLPQSVEVKKLGRMICHLRNDLGMSQAALAAKLEISHDLLAKMELGRAEPAAALWFNLCQFVGEDPDSLYTDALTLE